MRGLSLLHTIAKGDNKMTISAAPFLSNPFGQISVVAHIAITTDPDGFEKAYYRLNSYIDQLKVQLATRPLRTTLYTYEPIEATEDMLYTEKQAALAGSVKCYMIDNVIVGDPDPDTLYEFGRDDPIVTIIATMLLRVESTSIEVSGEHRVTLEMIDSIGYTVMRPITAGFLEEIETDRGLYMPVYCDAVFIKGPDYATDYDRTFIEEEEAEAKMDAKSIEEGSADIEYDEGDDML